ncbi:MAG TPA: helix-turn-helix domain-containing protein [Candidatus Saccharimonadales bacterium]|nr:helix-turn-helix domain-containing protein [Candidatus Saccharimonadales bacterium]
MNNKAKLIEDLEAANLPRDAAKLYIELFGGPSTHLQLARMTGINRTKVYRLVELLQKRGLVSKRTDDRGTFLVANDPSVLEIELTTEEATLKYRRRALNGAIPHLKMLHKDMKNPFVIHTYEGSSGLRQMQWHELQAKNELLTFGNTTIEDMVVDHYWAERMRERTVKAGYRTREIYNEANRSPDFTNNAEYLKLYEARRVSETELPVATPMVIYNDTVAIYQFMGEKRVGVEIINEGFARTMKSIFELYWNMAEKIDY